MLKEYVPQVDHTFEVRGVGSVVSGTAVNGSIAVGHRLLLGPNSDGDFTSVVVSGIQRSQVRTIMLCVVLPSWKSFTITQARSTAFDSDAFELAPSYCRVCVHVA
jgi:hypothetical protein